MASFGLWHILFMVAAYSAGLVCLYAVYRIGKERGWQWGAIHLLILCMFFVLYWLMESWASIRTPYYYYPPYPDGFRDWLAYYPWQTSPVQNLCIVQTAEDPGISISILLLETSLTFCAMHTTMLLAASPLRLLRPFMAALALLLLDFLLDPLASWSYDCLAGGLLHPGLGFWHWYVQPALGPDAFGVPLFNYAVWYSAPIALIALVGLFRWTFDLVYTPITITYSGITLVILLEGAFLALLVFAFTLIIQYSPNFAYLPIPLLRSIFVSLLLATLIAIFVVRKQFKLDNEFRWWFVYPQVIFVVFAVVAFLGSGLVTQIPYLWVVAVVAVPLLLLWSISPHWKKIWP